MAMSILKFQATMPLMAVQRKQEQKKETNGVLSLSLMQKADGGIPFHSGKVIISQPAMILTPAPV
jgi:hypothetical protein